MQSSHLVQKSPVNILAIGAHPDDVELGMGGTLAKHAAAGHLTAILDLTQGEMGSNGNPTERVCEGEAAAQILSCTWRQNLALPDRGLDYRDRLQLGQVVGVLRTARPAVVAVNCGVDRHPDHVAATRLVEEAVFTAGLSRYETELPPFRPAKFIYYFINDEGEPSFYVDITPFYRQKIESMFAHLSQFGQADGSIETRLNKPLGLPYLVESRDRHFGARLGVQYAEGFILKQPRLVKDLLQME